jgi:hypothetical protein
MKKLGLLLFLGLGLFMTSCNESTDAAAVVEGTEEVAGEMKCEAGKCGDDMKTACEPGCAKACCTADSTKTCTSSCDSTKTCTTEEAKACSMKKGQTCGDATCDGSCDTCIENCKTACHSKTTACKGACDSKKSCSKDSTSTEGKCADMKCEGGKCGK